jgi:hypothetical protein
MKIIARNDLRQVVGGGGDNGAGNPVETDGISYDDSTGNHIY